MRTKREQAEMWAGRVYWYDQASSGGTGAMCNRYSMTGTRGTTRALTNLDGDGDDNYQS